jgi:hemolysin III
MSVWPSVTAALSVWATNLFQIGGSLYTIGLVPWLSNSFEGHNAMWHAFVFAASCCFFAVCYVEIAAGNWDGLK